MSTTQIVSHKDKDEAVPSDRLQEVLSQYVKRLEGLKRSEEIVMPLIVGVSKEAEKQLDEFVKQSGTKVEKNDGVINYAVPVGSAGLFNKLIHKQQSFDSALYQTPRALLVALVSAFDAYLGELLRASFYIKPEVLNASARTLTFSELLEIGDITKAQDYLIEKEVESVIRESHTKHFEWMENRFGLPLRKGLECWPVFIELTERRNLFVHTDGVVSSQYLGVCSAHGVNLGKTKVGDRLSVGPTYFRTAFECLYEIGVKLCHVLWRKLMPEDLERADAALNHTCFDLLVYNHSGLARRLLEFGTLTLKKHHSNLIRRMLVVNLAISHKFDKNDKLAESVLSQEDWSDCGPQFQMALAVLNDKFDDAERIMREIGNKSKLVSRDAYETWPLFRDFRKSSQFLRAFKDIFGQDYEIKALPTPEAIERQALQATHEKPE